VLGWSRRLDDPTPADILRSDPAAAPGWAGIIAVHTTGAAETTSGVMRHLARALACFSHPHVIDACSPPRGAGFDIPDFLHANGTVYLLGKDTGLGAVAPLLTAFAQDVFDTAERLANRTDTRRLDPPLLGLLDEAPSIAPIPTLPALLADGRGRGIVIVYAMQSFSQAVTRWGTSPAETMANATNITVIFGGLSSAKDLADLERICGTRQTRRYTVHRGGERGARTSTQSWETIPVLRAGDIRTLPAGVALVLWGRLPPILARFPLLSQDRDWKAIRSAQTRRQHPDPQRLGSR
jgi:type IV secretory pathway TraG/TraD family ATPase VirD4